jgi:hypothetical protein
MPSFAAQAPDEGDTSGPLRLPSQQPLKTKSTWEVVPGTIFSRRDGLSSRAELVRLQDIQQPAVRRCSRQEAQCTIPYQKRDRLLKHTCRKREIAELGCNPNMHLELKS